MYKTIKYSSFIILSLLVILIFVTSRNYMQLILASLLYPILVVYGFRTFPRNKEIKEPLITIQKPEQTYTTNTEKIDISDTDKRAFLKLIGAAGISFFLISLFTKRASNIPFVKKVTGPDITSLEDAEGNKINPAQTHPTDGYRISEVDDNLITFYGFIRKGGAWFIMKEDTETGSFRYVKGEKNFSIFWNDRENLEYDYYSNVF